MKLFHLGRIPQRKWSSPAVSSATMWTRQRNSLTLADTLLQILDVTFVLSSWRQCLYSLVNMDVPHYPILCSGNGIWFNFHADNAQISPRSVTSSETFTAAAAVMAINSDFRSTGPFSSTFITTKCFHILGIVFVSFVNEVLKFSFALCGCLSTTQMRNKWCWRLWIQQLRLTDRAVICPTPEWKEFWNRLTAARLTPN